MSGLIVDLFAGGGGASVGIEAALSRFVDLAINHDPLAIAVHRANHPNTRHLEADVWEVQPREATGGLPVDPLWASPDCTHFSRAKGGKPRDHKNRSLAWVVVNWARETRPRIICLENVREFQTWGPLREDGTICPERIGQHYDEWTEALRRLGYAVESRVLDASLYGAPTRRLRLFVVARRDSESVSWPAPTHGPGRAPLRTAAECIDWSLPCPSIFERKRPLAPATQRRIAEGIRRFVLEAAEPFIVVCGHGRDPWRGQGLDEPMRTITTTHDARGLVAPYLVHTGNGERAGQSPRTRSADSPLGTVTATGSQGALVAASLTKFQENSIGRDLREPVDTVMAGAPRFGLVSAFLAKHYGGVVGHGPDRPLGTVTATDHHGLVAAHLTKFYGTSTGSSPETPAPSVTAGAGGGHLGLVSAFLRRHGIECPDPVTVRIAGDEYAIADIGLRMLEPHELLRAQFGEYANGYDLSAAKSKAAKIRLIGNSVCPDVARALVEANVSAAAAVAAAQEGLGL